MDLIAEPTLNTVKAFVLLDNDGARVFAKYYDDAFPTVQEQKAFEKKLFSKTHRANSEIVLLDGITVVYRSNVDLYFYVMGAESENELALRSLLSCVYESVSRLLRKNVEKRTLMENMDGLLMIVDETIDQGIMLECDSDSLSQRLAFRSGMTAEDLMAAGAEQSVVQIVKSVGDSFRNSYFSAKSGY